ARLLLNVLDQVLQSYAGRRATAVAGMADEHETASLGVGRVELVDPELLHLGWPANGSRMRVVDRVVERPRPGKLDDGLRALGADSHQIRDVLVAKRAIVLIPGVV